MKLHEPSFIAGIGLGIEVVARDHNLPTVAKSIIDAAGYSLQDYKNAGVDEFDLKAIAKVFKEEF